METSDVHVRVLFDFEYPTKDGKKVTIKEGEKLYLIKKTNEDWWQVIRNSGRPFYVPASYVEEVSRTASKNDKKFDTVREFITPKSQAPTDTYRMRSSSVDTQPTHDRIKPIIPKRTIFDTQRIQNREPTPVISPNIDCKDEEVDYVNIDKQTHELNVHSEISSNKTNHDLDKIMPLSASNNDAKSNNVSHVITSDDDTFTNGYSHVNFRTCNMPTVDNQLPISLSNSLEELSQEIAKKAGIIGNVKSDSGYSRIDNLVRSISKDIPVSAKNINEAGNSGLKQVNNNCESFNMSCRNDNELKNKLHYSGSFKTKHEREKWAKNYVLQSMREEEFQLDNSPIENDIPANNNDSNNNLSNIASSGAKLSTDNLNNTSTIKSDSSSGICKSDNGDVDSVKSDKNCDANISSPVTNEDRTDIHISTSSSISDNNDRHMKIYFDSSTEDLDKNPANWSSSRLTPSDKGSTDSLLDVDTQYSVQEELSICTTASDSLLHTSDTSEDGLSGVLREEQSLDDNQHKKKPALKRKNRVESCRLRFPIRGVSPPVPEEQQQPTRELFNGWCEYTFTDGRTFFYNSRTGEKSWKPPRRRCNTDDKNSKLSGSTCYLYSGSSSPLAEVDENHGNGRDGDGGGDDDNVFEKESPFSNVPKGWRVEADPDKGCKCFVNLVTGAKWFYSIDDEGRVYYFEENSTESSWTLPVAGSSAFNEKTEDQSQSQPDHVYSNIPVISRSAIASNENTVTAADNSRNRAIKSKSMILMEPKSDDPPVSFSSQKWPQLWNGQMCILKEGILNRTKITENAKRIRKNWTSSYVALTELSLLFFKDYKSFTTWKTNGGQQPEMCVDLNGALIDRGDKVSSRKNVYMISTLLGLQVLIQNDSTQQADLWLEAIQSVIKKLPFGSDSYPRLTRSPPANADDALPENESKKFYKVTRSKSVKAKNKDGSMEDLTVSPAERQTKIKAKLKKFFHRRPTMESLVKKGIWKDEPAFGCFLSQVAGNESPRVPLFVQRCINCIEKSEENMKTDGLYRASGNLSQVQKIRLQVDQNNLSVIEEEEEVHVLTGALKLFFRELKEPLIPFQLFHKAIKAAHNHNKKEKISQFREIVKALPPANYDTLKFLLQHLLRISKYQEYNRMHIPNIAIVFGPTLMWPEQESNNMALDLMQQNLVIECLLVEFDNIFR